MINYVLVGHCLFCLCSFTVAVVGVNNVLGFVSLQPCLIPSSSLLCQSKLVESGGCCLHITPMTGANRTQVLGTECVDET